MCMLPMYMGSLAGSFITTYGNHLMPRNQRYSAYRSVYEYTDDKTKGKRNVALQLMLRMLTHTEARTSGNAPPFAFPLGSLKPFDEFSVLPQELITPQNVTDNRKNDTK